ncbi:QRFP-like peptide receptor isoform 1-T1 [Salvelinus alpinus]
MLYLVIFGLAVVGNMTVLVLLCMRKALQSPSTFFICSLAFSDLLIAIVCVPATLLQHFITNWLAGRILWFLWRIVVPLVSKEAVCCRCVCDRGGRILAQHHSRAPHILQ